MRKRRSSLIGVVFAALVLFVLLFLFRLSVHRPVEVVLPELPESDAGSETLPESDLEAIRRIDVTPITVQRVIEGLQRPDSFVQAVTIDRYWQNGSGTREINVSVSQNWVRLDANDGRHVITGGGRTYIWYDGDTEYYEGDAAFSADEELNIPTYERILQLDSSAIRLADYRAFDSLRCIFVETVPDAEGYTERFWISVDNGLLIAAERSFGNELVYHMSGPDVTIGSPREDAFTLPNGTILFDPSGN